MDLLLDGWVGGKTLVWQSESMLTVMKASSRHATQASGSKIAEKRSDVVDGVGRNWRK